MTEKEITVTNLKAHEAFEARMSALERFDYSVRGGAAVLAAMLGILVTVATIMWPSAGEAGAAGKNAVGAPVGAIVAWMSDELPEGWKICDGTSIEKIEVKVNGEARLLDAEEKDVLRKSCAVDGNALPDLRGHFLRGAEGQAPHQSMLGATQGDTIREHRHDAGGLLALVAHRLVNEGNPLGERTGHLDWRISEKGATKPWKGTHYGGFKDLAVGVSGEKEAKDILRGVLVKGETGSVVSSTDTASETRPVNTAVHWIIRVR